MLKGLPPFMGADLLWVLAAMGHGDRVAIVDRNFPGVSVASHTRSGKYVALNGTDVVTAVSGILSLFPLDSFIDRPVACMDPAHQPGTLLPVQMDVLAACEHGEGRSLTMDVLDRFAFYEAAKNSFAVIHTTESRPYGCFLLTKGVVFDA
jgi:L-fucose mutarotase